MSSINALPEEVLSKVISFIQHDHAALRALTHVSHDFNCSTLPYLVRHISFIIRKPDHSFSTSFELFMRSLHENNKIALYVQTVKLRWSTGTSITKNNRRAYSRANDLLRELPNIRILSLSIIGPLPVPFDHGFLDTNPLPLLREFKLFDFNATAAHIAKYMIITPVKTMKIERLNVHAPLSRSIRETSPCRISKLSSLRLPYFHLPTSTLSDILCLPQSLEILHCTLPGDQELRFGALQASMRTALSPAAMTRVLEPVKDTLVELRLDDGILTRWPSHDRSRIDFSQLNALRRLGISSSCLFPFPTAKEKEREGLWRLLPSQLEELDVSCPTLHYKPTYLSSSSLHLRLQGNHTY